MSRKIHNKLDQIKKTKFAKMSLDQRDKQEKYFEEWTKDMKYRKKLGNEKYGDYMMKINKKLALSELREEFLDCTNHIVMLMYRIENLEEIK